MREASVRVDLFGRSWPPMIRSIVEQVIFVIPGD